MQEYLSYFSKIITADGFFNQLWDNMSVYTIIYIQKAARGHLSLVVDIKKFGPYNIPVNSGTPYGPIN